MPGWQKFYERHQEKINIVSVALDAQGAEKARPWVKVAKATYPTLIDRNNILGDMYNLKAIPFGIFIDKTGRLVKGPVSINIGSPDVKAELEQWLLEPGYSEELIASASQSGTVEFDETSKANSLFQRGIELLKAGQKEAAVAQWRKALDLDPKNLIIHKQIWAVEYPERFYDGDVDYDWQKKQFATEG